MGLFAAMLTYLVSAALLVGGMVTAIALFLAKPSDSAVADKPRPPLVRAADRQAAEALKVPKVAAPPQSTAASSAAKQTAVPQTAAKPPQLKAAEQTKQLAGQPARKKKVAKPAPSPSPQREPDTATLGYSPSEPRKFVFPLDPDW